jgi:hypothetical protein
MSSMSYFRICSMRSIQKTTFFGFIALLNKVLDFGGQLADKRFILGNVLIYDLIKHCVFSDVVLDLVFTKLLKNKRIYNKISK